MNIQFKEINRPNSKFLAMYDTEMTGWTMIPRRCCSISLFISKHSDLGLKCNWHQQLLRSTLATSPARIEMYIVRQSASQKLPNSNSECKCPNLVPNSLPYKFIRLYFFKINFTLIFPLLQYLREHSLSWVIWLGGWQRPSSHVSGGSDIFTPSPQEKPSRKSVDE